MKKFLLFSLLVLSGCAKEASEPEIPQYTLTVTANPAEGGLVNPRTGTYNSGQTVNILASANDFFAFSNWTGNWNGAENSFTLTMDSNKTITGNFEKYDLSDPNVKGYYINQDKTALQGLFVLDSENERGIEKIIITKKGVEYKQDDVILFKNIGSKRYEVYDYSDNYKIISTNRSLGIFIKATGELVVLDEDAINAISARFN